ncbi:MAG: hypothetical protein CMH27_00070 [Micavibrio sp.]|nr:hypothetical protein [Micavibrio sp.]
MQPLVNEIEINEKIFDPFMDLYIVFGRCAKNDNEPYGVYWQMRESSVLDVQGTYDDAIDARAHFEEAVRAHIEPHIHNRDPHAYDIYDWEDDDLGAYNTPVTKREARALVKDVAEEYGFSPPKIKFNKSGNYYYPDSNTIQIAAMDKITLLHELAHAMTDHQAKQTERPYIFHGPQFAWNAIELYQNYAGIDRQYLINTAAKHDILGDTQAKQIWDVDLDL